MSHFSKSICYVKGERSFADAAFVIEDRDKFHNDGQEYSIPWFGGHSPRRNLEGKEDGERRWRQGDTINVTQNGCSRYAFPRNPPSSVCPPISGCPESPDDKSHLSSKRLAVKSEASHGSLMKLQELSPTYKRYSRGNPFNRSLIILAKRRCRSSEGRNAFDFDVAAY